MASFKQVSIAMFVLAAVLALALIFAPEVIFWLFGLDGNAAAYFISSRAAMLFLGIAVLSWVGRNAGPSESRQAICLGLASAMGAMALLGIAEILRGYAGAGLFLAVAAEIGFAAAYGILSRKNV